MTGPVVDLERALAAAATIVDAVPDDRLDAASPCPGWTVTNVVEHVIVGNLGVAAAIDRELVGPAAAPSTLAGRFRDSSALVVAAFADPGVLSRPVTVPFGTVPGAVAVALRTIEGLVHGWDVAVASGQDTGTVPEDLAEAGIAFSESVFATRDRAELPFAPAVPVAADAPAIDRLAGLLGRRDLRR